MSEAILSTAILSPQEKAQIEGRDLDSLQEALGYRFKDAGLLDEALCHASFSNEHGLRASNERLEFLGDSALGFAVARALYRMYPEATEGQLTRMRSDLVCGASLTRLARELGVPELLLHGRSMRDGSLPASICEDAMEAILGAVCLDGGIEAAERVVDRLFLREVCTRTAALDPKSQLQIWLQAGGFPLPRYELLSVSGPSHAPVFRVRVWVQGAEYAASGGSRKGAESAAAAAALKDLREREPLEGDS